MTMRTFFHRSLLAFVVSACYMTQVSAEDGCRNQVWDVLYVNRHNSTALHSIFAEPWVSASQFRSTMSILQSCILTLVACIYKALHLNVPSRTSWTHTLRTKTKWVVLALLAPEIVLYMAASQFMKAKWLKRELKALQTTSKVVDKDFDFGLKYCFFVIMGGLTVPYESIQSMISIPDMDRGPRGYFCYVSTDSTGVPPLLLTPAGVVELAKNDHWIYLPTSKIDDKSKADILQKALVMFQVTWMATQCIARQVLGLPITLLEIHTMVHVVCAISLYAFWFQKPLDVQEPEVVFEEEWLYTLAVMIQKSFYRSISQDLTYFAGRGALPPSKEVAAWTQVVPHIWLKRGGLLPDGLSRAQERLERLARALSAAEARTNKPFPQTDKYGYTSRLSTLLGFYAREEENVRNISCLVLANSNLTIPQKLRRFNFSFMRAIDAVTDAPGLSGLALLLPMIYGGIHLTAWNYEFPTSIESLLWKIACLDIALSFLLLFLLPFALTLVAMWLYMICPLEIMGHFVDWIGAGIVAVTLVGYACSRAFIVVESFISLRHVPIGVYWTPEWLQMIPHF